MNDFLSLDNLPVIESKQNSQVRMLKKIVSSNSYRQESKLFWIEGEKLCKTYFENIETKKKLFLVFDQKININHIIKINSKLRIKEVSFTCLSSPLFREISQIKNSPGWGIVANYPENNLLEIHELNYVTEHQIFFRLGSDCTD